MNLHNFIIQLIQSDSLNLTDIKKMIIDPRTKEELLTTLLVNYAAYETLIRIKNGMDHG